jgi:hypothetical protein
VLDMWHVEGGFGDAQITSAIEGCNFDEGCGVVFPMHFPRAPILCGFLCACERMCIEMTVDVIYMYICLQVPFCVHHGVMYICFTLTL